MQRKGRVSLPAALALLVASAAPALAQEPIGRQADPADVGTIDGIVAAFYDVVSGPPGEPRQWERDATLYGPGTLFTIADSAGAYRNVTPAEFARETDGYLVESGFVEREIHRETRRFGRIAQVWSTYEWRTADGRTGRGINGLQLVHDAGRWWITHATWDNETPDRPIPAEYLPDE
ncbi:MAG TPA: hypothetical protein VJP59_12235 [Gemmatimonadota bacterium]|nr:hypothetical protein [Gemmatimonadota bacterium]